MRDILCWASAATLICLAFPPATISAATYTWDADTGTTGIQDGSGDWNTANTNWWDGSANVSWNSAELDWAAFGAGGTGSYTVTLAAGIEANRVIFNAGPNYTLDGGALSLKRKDSTDSRLTIVSETALNCPMIVEGNAWNKDGSGTLILNVASPGNTKYVNHSVGIIRLRNNQAAGSGYVNVSSGACLEVENDIRVANTVYIGNTSASSTTVNFRNNSGNNEWAGTVYIHNSYPYAIIGVDDGTLTISGRVRPRYEAVGSVTKTGAGTLVLSGNNDYRGPTYLSAGITTIRHFSALGTVDAGTTVAAGATLHLENDIAVGAEALTLSGTGIGGAGALRSLGGTNSWAGTVASSGIVSVGVDTDTLTLSGLVDGAGLTKVGTGTLVLSAANTYTGKTTIATGTLRLAGGDNRINPDGSFWAESGSVLDLNNCDQEFRSHSRLRESTLLLGTAILTVHSADLWASSTISGTGQFVKEGTGTITFGTPATYTGGTVINNGRIAMYSGSNRLPVTGRVEVNGPGILDLSFYATSSGTQTIGTLTGDGTVRISGATFVLGNGGGSSEFSGSIVDGLTVDSNSKPFGIGQMQKTGTGTITLSGQSTYVGATTVAGGALAVNGSIASSSGVLVNAGAALQGHGFVPVISGAGLIAPGNSAGILTAPSVNPAAGLDFAFEFNATGSPNYANAAESINDVLRLTDATPFAAALGSGNTIDVYLGMTDLRWGMTFRGGFYTDAADDFLGDIEDASFEYYVLGDGSGTYEYNGQSYYSLTESWPTWDIELATVPNQAAFVGGTANGYVMQLTAVPEPSSLALLVFALAGALLVRRR